MTPTISAIVPAYCEGPALADALLRLRDVLVSTGERFEIVVVDDGSTDETWPTLERAAFQVPELRALRLSRNFGKEGALAAGLDAAAGDAVILLDADLQHPPEVIPEMISTWRTGGVDVVNGVKRHRGTEGAFARLCARVFYRTFRGMTGLTLDGASDFKLLDRRVVDALCTLHERGRFFRGLVRWLGFNQVDVPFDVADRADGESKWSFFTRLSLAFRAITSFSAAPLQWITISGFVFLGFALLLGVQSIYLKATGNAVEGFTTVIVLILILGSVLMFGLGLIGRYLAEMFVELKGRPLYLVQDDLRGSAHMMDLEPLSSDSEIRAVSA